MLDTKLFLFPKLFLDEDLGALMVFFSSSLHLLATVTFHTLNHLLQISVCPLLTKSMSVIRPLPLTSGASSDMQNTLESFFAQHSHQSRLSASLAKSLQFRSPREVVWLESTRFNFGFCITFWCCLTL